MEKWHVREVDAAGPTGFEIVVTTATPEEAFNAAWLEYQAKFPGHVAAYMAYPKFETPKVNEVVLEPVLASDCIASGECEAVEP